MSELVEKNQHNPCHEKHDDSHFSGVASVKISSEKLMSMKD
jgi:hypothetical protein